MQQKYARLMGIRDGMPKSYQIIGDILLIKPISIKKQGEKKQIAQTLLRSFPRIKTVCEIRGISGELREPKVRKLIGNGFETVHKEHGILYKLDVSKVMFSKGNLFERQRLLEQVKSSETVLDMFAGIGYFSLGLAKKAKNVYAVEKNKIAFEYLKENCKLNKINNIEAMLGDCRKIELPKADRIMMGYFPHTERFLAYALSAAKKKSVVHFHNTYRINELWKKPEEQIAEACKKFGYQYNILEKKKVKSIAPKVYHIVMDVEVSLHPPKQAR